MSQAASAWTASGRPASARRRYMAPSTALCWLALVTAFGLSHLMLERLGIAYETSGGASWQKIAPATYLSIIAILALAIEQGPENLLNDVVRRHKGTLVLAFAWLIQFFQLVIIIGAPLTPTIDTFIYPICLLVLIARQDERTMYHMALFIHFFMAVNAIIAGVEFVTQTRITPMFANGIELVDWRSSALFGHPLMNALATGCYALALMLGGGRSLPRVLFLPALGLQMVAMVFFGGRAATALLVVFAVVLGARHAVTILLGRRFSALAAAIAFVLVPTLVVAGGILVAEGFLDRFLLRFVDDEGSAQARLIMFDVLGRFSWQELLVGPDAGTLATLQRVYGIPFGIESFWFAFIAFYGILTSIPIFLGLFAFLYDIRRLSTVHAWWVIGFFLAVCSTSLSLAGKSTTMGVLLATIIVTMRPAMRQSSRVEISAARPAPHRNRRSPKQA
ncbi:MAG: hypothetical protein IT548_06730 [Alphaproteobacteria bacterium]|nr:hypothetical protein [Alphaproteobacteria bacterium]